MFFANLHDLFLGGSFFEAKAKTIRSVSSQSVRTTGRQSFDKGINNVEATFFIRASGGDLFRSRLLEVGEDRFASAEDLDRGGEALVPVVRSQVGNQLVHRHLLGLLGDERDACQCTEHDQTTEKL